MIVNRDCKFYKGHIPCKPHKDVGTVCEECKYYSKIQSSILIIKLGAAGDVIRTTPLLERIGKEFPGAHVTWMTEYPQFVPKVVDEVMSFNLENVQTLLGKQFDLLINLDKDAHACSLSLRIAAKKKVGFLLEKGLISPADENARHKWLTGLFDTLNRANRKSYMVEMFEICGFEYRGEEYCIDFLPKKFKRLENVPTVGLNTGCGSRWLTRLWKEANWVKLADGLAQKGYQVIFLGGPDEDKKNKRLAKKTGQKYLGVKPLEEFVAIVDNCDLVVTGVSMAMHIAIALKKNLVVLNNVFNRHEFEMFGLGEIIEPEGLDCLGCFKGSCEKEDCMNRIEPSEVLDTCLKYMRQK